MLCCSIVLFHLSFFLFPSFLLCPSLFLCEELVVTIRSSLLQKNIYKYTKTLKLFKINLQNKQTCIVSQWLIWMACIVKWVSWFKSSLLLRIKSNTRTNYNSWLKLGIAFLIGNYIQQMKEGDQTWLGLGS